jgi:hypothetical protein
MKTKKKGMYAKGGMKMYAKDGSMVKALKSYAVGGKKKKTEEGEEIVSTSKSEKMGSVDTARSIEERNRSTKEANQAISALKSAYQGLGSDDRKGKKGQQIQNYIRVMQDSKRGAGKDQVDAFINPKGQLYKSNITLSQIDKFLGSL